jgi:hypothetical protein
MTKMKFGDQHDDSVAQHEVISAGGTSEIAYGDQYDRSHLSSRVLDLKDPADLALVASHLSSFVQQVQARPEGKTHPDDVRALDQAAKHAAAGEGDSARKCLVNVGKWVLKTASAIGTPVAIEFLKSCI